MKFNVKITLADKYEATTSYEAEDELIALQEVTESLRNMDLVCDLRVEVVAESSSIHVEVEDTSRIFRFRARFQDQVTPWCNYTEMAYINGHVIASGHYHPEVFQLTPLPVELHMLMGGAAVPESETAKLFKTDAVAVSESEGDERF